MPRIRADVEAYISASSQYCQKRVAIGKAQPREKMRFGPTTTMQSLRRHRSGALNSGNTHEGAIRNVDKKRLPAAEACQFADSSRISAFEVLTTCSAWPRAPLPPPLWQRSASKERRCCHPPYGTPEHTSCSDNGSTSTRQWRQGQRLLANCIITFFRLVCGCTSVNRYRR